MKTMQTYGHYNGKILTAGKIMINPYDLGFMRGYAVFDVMCTQNSRPFLLDEHWRRLQNSARELHLKIPMDKKNYEKTVKQLLKTNNFSKANIRTILTGGESPNGFHRDFGKFTFIILIEKFVPLANEIYEKGAALITAEHERHIPRAKICNYVEAIRHQQRKLKNKALEIIYTKKGKALEASTSNFFIIKKGKLITTRDGVLHGITRNLVIRLAQKNGYEVLEKDISLKELFSADEVFLTATNKDVVPVVKIDGKKVGNEKVGKNTKILMHLFREFVKNY